MSEAPEPTFLEKLRAETAKPREVMTVDGAWNQGYGEAELICLLVNNAEKIAALIEAARLVDDNYGMHDPLMELHAALAALNEGVQ